MKLLQKWVMWHHQIEKLLATKPYLHSTSLLGADILLIILLIITTLGDKDTRRRYIIILISQMKKLRPKQSDFYFLGASKMDANDFYARETQGKEKSNWLSLRVIT